MLTAVQAGASGLARRINPDKFYVACRWPLGSYDFLRSASLHVLFRGKSAIARAVDWGPNVKTGRVADLSPGLLNFLGASTDDVVTVTVGIMTVTDTQ